MRTFNPVSERAGPLTRAAIVCLVVFLSACSSTGPLSREADRSAAPTPADTGTDSLATRPRGDTVPHGETLSSLSYRPGTLTGETPPESPSGRARRVARQYLREQGGRFGLASGGLSELTVTSVEALPMGYRVNFVQTRRGLPVFNGGMKIVLDRSHRVVAVLNRYVPDQGRPAKPALDPPRIKRALEAWVAENPSKSLPSTPLSVRELEPGYWFDGKATHLVYRGRLVGGEHALPYQVLIDAGSGNVLRQKKLFKSQGEGS